MQIRNAGIKPASDLEIALQHAARICPLRACERALLLEQQGRFARVRSPNWSRWRGARAIRRSC